MPFLIITASLVLSFLGAGLIVGAVQGRENSLVWIGCFLIWLAIGFGYAAGRWS